MKHTPGPWKTAAPASYRINTSGPIRFVPQWGGAANSEELTANAHLISAAPDLLSVLEALVETDAAGRVKGDLWHKARAAIAKARGEGK